MCVAHGCVVVCMHDGVEFFVCVVVMFNVLAQGPSKTTGRSSLCIIRSEMSHENVLFTTEIYLFASTVRALQENKNGRNKEITIVSLASDSKMCL